jgi:hypothetical protein
MRRRVENRSSTGEPLDHRDLACGASVRRKKDGSTLGARFGSGGSTGSLDGLASSFAVKPTPVSA